MFRGVSLPSLFLFFQWGHWLFCLGGGGAGVGCGDRVHCFCVLFIAVLVLAVCSSFF